MPVNAVAVFLCNGSENSEAVSTFNSSKNQRIENIIYPLDELKFKKMVLIGLVDCPNDNLKMYITKRLIVNGLYFLVIAYNSINLRVSSNYTDMKLLFILLLTTTFTKLCAQSQQDSLELLRVKAKSYLNLIYTEKNFKDGFKMWGSKMLKEAKIMYKMEDTKTNDSLLFEKAELDFKRHYLKHSNFKLIEIYKETIDSIQNSPNYTISYIYTENLKSRSNKLSDILTLIFEKESSEWKVVESKGLHIIYNVTRN